MNETIALIRKNEDTGAQEQKTATSYDQARAFLDEWEEAELAAAKTASALTSATASTPAAAPPAAPAASAKPTGTAPTGPTPASTGGTAGRKGGERMGPGAMKKPVAKAKKAAKRKR